MKLICTLAQHARDQDEWAGARGVVADIDERVGDKWGEAEVK